MKNIILIYNFAKHLILMTEIFVKSLPLKDVISNLAEAFDTVYFNRCHEYQINIPEKYGTGFIRGINFICLL